MSDVLTGLWLWAQGKRTYFIAIVICLYAVVQYMQGTIDAHQMIDEILGGAGLGALRSGIANK